MALEDTTRQINAHNARAANFSASNEASQVVNDTNENLIKTAELAAAWRTLGLTDDQGMALVARQQKLNPAISESEVQQSLITAAQDLDSQELGLVTRDKYLNPNAIVEFGKDEADLQSLSVDEQQEGRETDLRKKAKSAIEASILDSQKDQRRIRNTGPSRDTYADGRDAATNENLDGYSGVPQRVLERRIAPQDRLDTGGGQTRATGSSLSGTQLAMKDAFDRMEAAFSADPSLRTVPGAMKTYYSLGSLIFPDSGKRAESKEAQQVRQESLPPINSEVAARNAAKTITPQESLILESATRGLERMGEIEIRKNGPGKDNVSEIPKSTIKAENLPIATLGADGAYYDAPEGNPLSRQGPVRPEIGPQDGVSGLILDNLYAYDKSGNYPQVGINQSVNLLQHRLGTKIPSKWGTLQNAPTTIRGIADLDQALNSVLSLAADNKKALVEMPDAGKTGKPKVAQNPGGMEALYALGYNRPEAGSLLNAVAQLEMGANIQINEAQKAAQAETGKGYFASNVPVKFNSPEQMGDFQVDHIVGPIENSQVRGLFRGLRGENIGIDFDDPEYSPERVLNMAQQNFGGQVLRTNDNTGVISNSQPPIGGISGNKNYMYNKLGIRDLGDLRYALEQQSLRRDARIKRQPGDPVRRQVGTVSPTAERNIIRSLLATERANRDERKPKALPAAGESLASRESAFLAEQGRRAEVIRAGKERSALAALTQPSGRRPLAAGEWVRASDGNVRVMGQGGIPFDRDGAIAVNMNSNKSTSYDIPTSTPSSDPWSGSATTPNAQPQAEQQQQRLTNGPAQGPVPGSAGKQFSDRANFARKSPRYQTGRRVGYGVGGGVTGLLGLDALIGDEQNKRQEVAQ